LNRRVGLGLALLCALFVAVAAAALWEDRRPARSTDVLGDRADPGLLLLLVPDGTAPDHPAVRAWQDAARELGLRMAPVTDARFLQLGDSLRDFAGLVLPDSLHTVASDEVVAAVRNHVVRGGRALLTFDFGTLRPAAQGPPVYAVPHSRLSDLAGVQYALHHALGARSTGIGPVLATPAAFRQLQVPPGKSMPADAALAAGAPDDGALPVAVTRSRPEGAGNAAGLHTLSGYLAGPLRYSSFVTAGNFPGRALAVSPTLGLVAGVHRFGSGEVLFVNLPLGYLKGRTDALPMHGFLRYFAQEMLQLAHLSPMPDGVGGLTLNWHLDSSAAQEPTLALERAGVFDHGPFSVHMTAGPDTRVPGDRLGWNLDQNPVAKDILRRMKARGHDVGSHGGWVHDYFGLRASEANRAEFLPYLEMNFRSVEAVVGPGTSYSAPLGNNPTWAMDWLESRRIRAVYDLGHTGLGPTRPYRDGERRHGGIVLYPVTPMGTGATFEEFQAQGIPAADVQAWYRALADFCRDQGVGRMVYMHPPGAQAWLPTVQDLLAYVKAQGPQRLRWYTMTQLADALEHRAGVQWHLTPAEGGAVRFEAWHRRGLEGVAWRLPKARHGRPVVADPARATVVEEPAHWLVRAGDTRRPPPPRRAVWRR